MKKYKIVTITHAGEVKSEIVNSEEEAKTIVNFLTNFYAQPAKYEEV